MHRQSDSDAYNELARAVCSAHFLKFGYSSGDPLYDLEDIVEHMNWADEIVDRQVQSAQRSINETFSIMRGLANALPKE